MFIVTEYAALTYNVNSIGVAGVFNGVLQGFWGEGLFIFKELGSTGNYFRDLGASSQF